ncbi:MAG: hypothetical protein QOH63_153 [Acidobacteriota bacterium]|nr:hypothetical protein [Acidobacteriota bacterium]
MYREYSRLSNDARVYVVRNEYFIPANFEWIFILI